ncbi:hypothetical protein HAX54_051250, partial [Datura stramonium]|nr:hypothetical protein [Datura stramonium]
MGKIGDDELEELLQIQRDALDSEIPENSVKLDDKDEELSSNTMRPGRDRVLQVMK